MQVKRVVRTEDGNVEATLMLTPEQLQFFLNVGIGVLVQQGAIQVVDYSEEEFKKELAKAEQAQQQGEVPAPAGTEQKPIEQQQKEFLQNVDISALHKA